MPRKYAEKGPFAVYRMFSADSELLYVGQSVNPCGRVAQHRLGRDWMRAVVNMTFVWFETREEAQAEEIRAIQAEKPRHNIAFNPVRPKRVRIVTGGENLRAWMAETGTTVAQLAQASGLSTMTVAALMTDSVYPQYRTASRIFKATGGAVGVENWSRSQWQEAA